jgi:hypothetical protein
MLDFTFRAAGSLEEHMSYYGPYIHKNVIPCLMISTYKIIILKTDKLTPAELMQ